MSDQTIEQHVELGKSGLMIPPMGTGAWSWGDQIYWGYGRGYAEDQVQGAFDVSMANGINFFDTAEAYGFGKSERLLGQFAAKSPQPVIIATKFLPYPWRIFSNALETALRQSLNRLGRPQVDLYQIHFPLPPLSVETRARQLARVVQAGLAKTVGVSNYSANQMRRTSAVLNEAGIPLASNQVEYSLLNRKAEWNGVWETCQEKGITLIAYSPLGKGMLTGKYSPENPPQGARSRQYTRNYLARIQPLIRLMREIGQEHESKSPAQVALNWCICKGAVPIPGAKNTRQAQENAGALGWRLRADEMDALDRLSRDLG